MVERASKAPFHNNYSKSIIKHNNDSFMDRLKYILGNTTLMFVVMGFVIGRVSILNSLSPFGAAFLVSVALMGGALNTSIVGIGIVLGLLTRFNGSSTVQSIISLMLIFIGTKVLKFGRKTSIIKAGAFAFVVNFLVALSSSFFINGALILYDTLMGLFNSTILMALIYIYNYSMPMLIDRKRRNMLSSEEIICFSIVCAIIISGLSDIFIYNVSLKVVLSVVVIAIAAHGQGAGVGTSIGTTIGLITCISSNQVPIIIGTYAFCGLLCGIFKDMGKIGSALGFIIADVIILFYLGGDGGVIKFKELMIGTAIFMVFPSSFIQKAAAFIDSTKDIRAEQSYVDRMKDIIRSKIIRVTDVFGELTKTLEEKESDERLKQNGELNSIINSVVDKVCFDCSAKGICWSRDFYNTYQSMFELLDVIQADGKVDMDNMPIELKKKCLKANHLIKTGNHVFDIYRMNYKWRKKAQEGKRVLGEQLDGVVKVLKGLSEDIDKEVRFNKDIEEEIAVALDKEGIEFSDVVVVKDNTNRMEVNIYKKACLGRRECIKEIGPVVSKVLRKRMLRDRTSCMIKEGSNLCCFKLIEEVKYQISTGVAREIKDEGGLSGDNYSFIELNDGKYMMALSDGMGTGPTAAAESNSAITLLEKYLEAGFDRATALKSINSMLALKSSDDNFATIDLAIADLYKGEAEFVKIGAASTFIKRGDGSVETISSTTLPIGILNSLDIESKTVKLSSGDFIVMVTDGIEEAGETTGSESWIVGALKDIESRNPKQIAEELLKKAKDKNEGNILDDMTVLVSKIWEI